ncbi:unnamed protein product (macronuclear) [Paramecium tetraurelia]|uniref:Protein kinase domain-containing protein n=1 Tax=Paramecium tetraurelia TaxID=5888 RepID=A0CF70_PARTE|nr:uncharacterized protein GSPATT00037876001 [Paramecium tetraurelia]CAK69437.1 unnamed protein product [Paramecium tetraurelia]|eukprot:XP_001436834.1 hypothetical protein (macronuclear) [Paramecium tetraurelia strain d4-2]
MKISNQIIGTGSTSTVYVAEIENLNYAIKIYKNNYSLKMINKEIALLKQVNHPNIIKIIDSNVEKKFIITELLNDMDLFDIIAKDQKPLNLNSMKHFSQKLASVVQYLHSISVAHRDIKLENILIDEDFNLKLCDFGFAEIMDTNFVQKCQGTLEYLAPEIKEIGLINAKELAKTDVFSLGVCIFILAFAHPPYKVNVKSCPYWNLLQSGQWQTYWQIMDRRNKYDQSFYSLMQGMLEFNPQNRFTIEEVLHHPFLIGDWQQEFETDIRVRLKSK